ncbi:hypothetical protein K440DRAFT_131605 [Wilcoxina mikolae CBS 423.85]|nr:hypothetical protein K440DRAFT_131605 [Wilcoxina mikolae CBS 423.85]
MKLSIFLSLPFLLVLAMLFVATAAVPSHELGFGGDLVQRDGNIVERVYCKIPCL